MKEFKRICGFNRLAQVEQVLYKSLKSDCDEYSVTSTWRNYGVLQNELNHMYFIDGLLTESEFDILDSYVFDVIYNDCYNNMMNRMKVRDKDER